jgi:protocatechuate 3,4-dioxygenase beta subunit
MRPIQAVLILFVLAFAPVHASVLSVEGPVLGPDGQALAGARVELRPVLRVYEQGVRDLEGRGEPEAVQAVSGADGWFRIQVPFEGPWRTKVTADGFSSPEFTPRMVIGEETLNPAWMVGATADVQRSTPAPAVGSHPLTLEVFDGSKPVPAAVVRDRASSLVLGRTGADGSLLLDAPSPKTWTLRIETRGGRIALYDVKPVPAAAKPEARVRRRFLLPPAVILAGRVVDQATGKPIAGARVWPVADPAAFVVAGAGGAYRLPWTRGTPVELSAKADGHFATVTSFLPDGRTAPPALALWPARMLEGVVVRAGGEPVAEAEVRVFGRIPRFAEAGRTRSSVQGRFRVPVLNADNYDVLAVAPGLAPAFEIVTLGPGAAGMPGIRLVMQPGRSARGRVADEKGRPVASARVELKRSPASLIDPSTAPPDDSLHEAQTDADGRFEIAGLPAGWYDLAVSRPGFLPASEPALEVADAGSVLDLGTVTLRPGRNLSGRVTDPDGKPLAGAEVRPVLATPGLEGAVTGEDGRFLLEGIAPGNELRLAVCRPDRGSEVIEVPELPEVPVEIVLKPAGRISGRVAGPDGEPVAGALVLAGTDTDSPFFKGPCPMPGHAQAHTGPDGRFVFFPLGPGMFSISALKKDFIGAAPVAVEVQPGVDAEAPPLVLARGSAVTGRVVTADGSPAPATLVSLPAPDESYFLPAIADGDGFYRIEGVPAGEHRIEARHSTMGSGSRMVTVAAGENRVDLKLEPEERSFARGWVVDPDGAPLSSALVEDKDGRSVYSGGDGSFAIEVLKDNFDLTARKAGYTPAHLSHWTARGALDGLELRLGRGASLSGRILGVEPADAAQARVTAYNDQVPVAAMVNSEGIYRFPGLEPASWTVEAAVADRSTRRQVEIAPSDEEVVADLSLPERYEVSGRVLGPAGEPEEEVYVGLSNAEGDRPDTSTAEDGTFTLQAYDGTYDLVVATVDSSMVHGQVTVAGGPVEGLEIRLAGRAVLSGHILGIPEDELNNVSVEVGPGYENMGSVDVEEKSYVVEDIGPGNWKVTGRSDLNSVTRNFTVRPGQTAVEVDLLFTPGDLTLAGHLTGYRVLEQGTAALLKDGEPLYQKADIVDGTFTFSRLKPGHYHFYVQDNRSVVLIREEIELTASMELNLELGED